MPTLTSRLRLLARDAITWSARDVTEAAARRSALVVAPHPDDETLGCGATVLRKRAAGSRVTVLMVTDGSHSHDSVALPAAELAARRAVELHTAARRLGVAEGELRFAAVEDGTVAEHEGELTALVAALIAELAPDEVYTTSALEPHSDHAAVGRAVRAAAADAGTPVLEYAVWLWGAWPLTRGNLLGSVRDAAARLLRRSTVAVSTAGFADAKQHALEAHATQLARPADVPADEPWKTLPVEVLAASRGRREVFFPVHRGSR